MNDLPKWVQIANSLRSRIYSGELKPSERVYITHEAEAHGVAKATIHRAIRFIEVEGLLERIPERGFFVRPGVIPKPPMLVTSPANAPGKQSGR